MTAVISPRFPTQRPPKPDTTSLTTRKQGRIKRVARASRSNTNSRPAGGGGPAPRVPPENGPVINGKRPGRLRALPRSTNVVQMRDDTLPHERNRFRDVATGTFRYWYRTET